MFKILTVKPFANATIAILGQKSGLRSVLHVHAQPVAQHKCGQQGQRRSLAKIEKYKSVRGRGRCASQMTKALNESVFITSCSGFDRVGYRIRGQRHIGVLIASGSNRRVQAFFPAKLAH